MGNSLSATEFYAATLGAVAGIDAAKTPTAAGVTFGGFADRFGLTHASCFILPEIGTVAGKEYVFYSNPGTFAERVLSDPAVFDDIAFVQLQSGAVTVQWSDDTLRQTAASGQNGLFTALGNEGLEDGLLIPLFGSNGLIGTMLLGGANVVLGDDAVALLKLVSMFFYGRICSMRRDALREQYGLSAREFEYMKWVAAGKTDWETGRILSISPKTVNYHVENAKRKFDVSTRLQAVVAAIMSGAVDP